MKFTNNTRGRSNSSLLFLLIILSHLVLTPPPTVWGAESDDKKDRQDPCVVERAIGFTGLNTRWDVLRAWAKLAWLNLRPPRCKSWTRIGHRERQGAAARSFETSKETVQQTAASAAELAGKAAEKTREKLKRTSSRARDSKSEL